jgi:hypothetical protein
MKNAFIRLLSIVTLASSLSAFALSDKAKTASAAKAEPACATASQDAQTADQDKGQADNDQEKARQRLIKQQDEQWLHDTQYIPAG